MGLTLELVFSGLMAFAPTPDGKEMLVLMVNARDGVHSGGGGHGLRHQPYIEFDCRSVYPGEEERCSEEYVKVDDYLHRYRLHLDQGYDISLEFEGLPEKLPPFSLVRCREFLPNGSSKEAKSCLVELGRIEPRAAKVDPEFLKPELGEVERKFLASRTHLTFGTMKPYYDAYDPPDDRAWRFSESRIENRWTGWVPNRAVVSIEMVNATALIVWLKSWKDGTPRKLRLQPVLGRVEASIGNEPSDEDFCRRRPLDRWYYDHFEVFYRLAGLSPSSELPTPYLYYRVERQDGDDWCESVLASCPIGRYAVICYGPIMQGGNLDW